MGKKSATRVLLLGALSLPVIAQAQDQIDALRMRFGISERIETGRNLQLDYPELGSSTISTTTLSFGITKDTDVEKLNFGVSGALQIQNTPDTDGTETDFADPRFTLSYDRNGENADLSVFANYFQSNIDTLTLQDFIDANGDILLPEDFQNLQGNGTRTSYGAGILLQTNEGDPLRFNLSAGASGIDYSGAVDPDLYNYNRAYAGVKAFLRLSDVARATAALRYSTYDAQDSVETYRTTTLGTVGFEYDISARASLNGSIGMTHINTEEIGSPDDTVDKPVGNLGYTLDMPNGAFTADLAFLTDAEGAQRTDLIFGRSLELPDGGLSFTIGLTDPEFGNVEPIGSLNWRRKLPAGTLSAQLARKVTTWNTDETSLSSLVALNYRQSINEISGFGLTATYAQADGTESSDASWRSGLTASYYYQLTQDWNLDTGVSYRTYKEDGMGGTATSPLFYVTIARNFDFTP